QEPQIVQAFGQMRVVLLEVKPLGHLQRLLERLRGLCESPCQVVLLAGAGKLLPPCLQLFPFPCSQPLGGWLFGYRPRRPSGRQRESKEQPYKSSFHHSLTSQPCRRGKLFREEYDSCHRVTLGWYGS